MRGLCRTCQTWGSWSLFSGPCSLCKVQINSCLWVFWNLGLRRDLFLWRCFASKGAVLNIISCQDFPHWFTICLSPFVLREQQNKSREAFKKGTKKGHHCSVKLPADNLRAGKCQFYPENRKLVLGLRLWSNSQLMTNLFFLSVKYVFFGITWLYPIHSSCFWVSNRIILPCEPVYIKGRLF